MPDGHLSGFARFSIVLESYHGVILVYRQRRFVGRFITDRWLQHVGRFGQGRTAGGKGHGKFREEAVSLVLALHLSLAGSGLSLKP